MQWEVGAATPALLLQKLNTFSEKKGKDLLCTSILYVIYSSFYSMQHDSSHTWIDMQFNLVCDIMDQLLCLKIQYVVIQLCRSNENCHAKASFFGGDETLFLKKQFTKAFPGGDLAWLGLFVVSSFKYICARDRALRKRSFGSTYLF